MAEPASDRSAAARTLDGAAELLLVVPTYNERDNLEELVARVFAAAPGCHLLIVDDDSPDGTAELCRELRERYPRLRLLHRKEGRGLGRAYLAGLDQGLRDGFELVGTMDADLSHNPDHLPQLLQVARSHDVVIGSRYVRDGGTINWRIRRILLSWLANMFAARLLGMPVHDATSGYRLYRAGALRRLALQQVNSTGYSFLVELLFRLHRLGCSIGESPIIFYDRTLGESKLGSREIWIGALRLLRLRLPLAGIPRTPPAASQTSRPG
jgi:dolichol-phosphate mannosyltransferase